MSGKGSIGGGIGDGDSCNWMKMKFVRNLRRYYWSFFFILVDVLAFLNFM